MTPPCTSRAERRDSRELSDGVIIAKPRTASGESTISHASDGATLNNRKIRVSRIQSVEGALLGTGFPFKNPDDIDDFLRLFGAFFKKASDMRRAGSAALDLAYVAAGRLDGFWESGLNAWDIAAGALIVREAGGLVTDYAGDEHFLENGQVVAGNPKVTADMLRTIARQLKS